MNRLDCFRLRGLLLPQVRRYVVRGLLALTVLATPIASAASDTWQGPTGNTWGDPLSWLGGTPPGTTDFTPNSETATFGATGVGNVDLNALTFTLGTVSITNLTGGYTFSNGTLDLSNITLANTSGANVFNTLLTDQADGGLVINSSVAQVGGTTLTLTGATISSNLNAIVGTTSIANRSALSFYGAVGALAGLTTTGTYSIANGGVYFNSVNTASLGGNWTVGGNWLVENGGTVTFVLGSTYNIAGDVQTTGSTLNVSALSSVGVGGNLIVGAVTSGVGTNGTPTLNIGAALTNLGGTLQLAGGTVNVNTSNPFFSTSKVLEIAPSTASSQTTTLSLATGMTLDNAITVGTGAGTTTIQGAASSIFNGTITLGKAINLNSSGTAAVFNGLISGAGISLTINSTTTGVVALANNSNSFGGVGSTVTIAGGLARVSANGAFGDANNGLNFNGGGIQFNTTSYDLTTAGRALTFNNTKTFTVDTNGVATTTFANSFGGSTSMAFVKTGTGTLILGAAESYSGGTTLSGGTLQTATATNGLGTNSAITINGNNAVLDLRSNTSATFQGSAAYAITTGNTTTINVANNGSGTGNTISLGSVSFTGNTTLNVTNANSYILSLGSITHSGNGNLTLSPTAAGSFLTIGTIQGSGTGSPDVRTQGLGTTTITGAMTAGAVPMIFERSGQAGTTIIQGTSANFGTGNVVVTSGTLQTAVMTNAFGNATTISMGGGILSLKADASAAFGNGTTAYNFATTNGTTINTSQVNGSAAGTAITIGNYTIGGNHVTTVGNSNGVSLNIGAVTSTFSGTPGTSGFSPGAGSSVTIASIAYSSISAATNLSFGGTGTTTVTGTISQNGTTPLSLLLNAGGTLILKGNNTYTGDTTVSNAASVLVIGSNQALGTTNGSGAYGTLTLSTTGVTLQATGGAQTINNNFKNGNITWKVTGSNDLTFNGSYSNFSQGAAIQTIDNSGITTFAGLVYIRGDASAGARTLTLGGSGRIVISSTAVIHDGLSQTGTQSAFAYNGTGSITMIGNSTYLGATNLVAGTMFVSNNAPSGSAGAFGAGTLAFNLGSTNASFVNQASLLTTGAFTVDRAITEVGAPLNASLTIGGNHTTGTSTYTGAITLQKDTTLVAGTGGQVDFTAGITSVSATASKATIGATGFAGTVRVAATSSINTTAAINVAFGKLRLDGNITGGGTAALATGLTVASGATLAGSGATITKAVTIANGGHLAPGSATSLGILNISGLEAATPVAGQGTLNFGATGIFDADLTGTGMVAGTNFDQINLTGSADLGGATLNLTTTGLVLSEAKFYTLIANDSTDALLGTFNYAQDATILTLNDFDLKISYVGEGGASSTGGNDVVLYTSPVPEPASVGLLTVAGMALLARKRRKTA